MKSSDIVDIGRSPLSLSSQLPYRAQSAAVLAAEIRTGENQVSVVTRYQRDPSSVEFPGDMTYIRIIEG